MTNEEIIEQLENAIGLIKQDGKDWLDDRDIPILEACIKSLTALNKIRAEIIEYECFCRICVDERPSCKQCNDNVFETIYGIFDKYKAESEVEDGNNDN